MNGELETFEFNETGQLIQFPNGQLYLRYVEHQAGQETSVQFRLDGPGVRLDRRGIRPTRLQFLVDQETLTRYQTDYGTIQLMVATQKLEKDVNVAEHCGQILVRYELINAGQVLGTYRIQLQFQA